MKNMFSKSNKSHSTTTHRDTLRRANSRKANALRTPPPAVKAIQFNPISI